VAAHAGEPRLQVYAVDADTGETLSDIRCALVAGTGTVRASFDGAQYDGDAAPGDGDVLQVYRRGHDLATAPLAAGQREVTVRLAPARDACRVVLRGPHAERVGFKVVILSRVQGEPGADGLRDGYERTGTGALDVPLPRGMATSLFCSSDQGTLWPLALRPAPGETCEVRLETPRVVALRGADRLRSSECLPDFAWDPGRVPPERIDAWLSALNRPAWLGNQLARHPDRLRVDPPVPFHLFAVTPDGPLYRYAGPAVDTLDLTGPRTRRVDARPVVDGAPVPAGTVLAPGRLDLLTVASLPDLPFLAGCCEVLGNPGEEWPGVALPAADWLTAWHRDRGLAHLRWDATPKGRTFPGRVTMKVPRGFEASGTMSLFPLWKGTGAVHTTPPDRRLRWDFTGTAPLVVRGLAPGRYGMLLQVTLHPQGGGEPRPITRRYEFDVTADAPAPSYRLPLR